MTALAHAEPRDAPAAATPDAPSADALARRFTERWGVDARYVAAWDRWMVFDGIAWRPDVTLRVLAAARGICRAAAEEAPQDASHARVRARLGGVAAVAAVERLARLDRRHLATADQWDADPWLLNTPGGTVDLRDGTLRPHRREDYITRVTSVAPGGACPRFLAVLERLFACDRDLVAFVQRALGRALAGAVAEPAVFLACGPAGSGKSLLFDTVVAILGGYAAAASLASLGPSQALASRRKPHDDTGPTGARLLVALEDGADLSWDAAAIQALAGGGPGACAAADHRGCALFVAGRHPPALRDVDATVRRRLKIIPFGATIPDDQADRDLPRTLRDEWPGILAWMIAGCREWQRAGLAPPQAVVAASAEYLAQEDTLGDWFAQCVRENAEWHVTAADLYRSWCHYAAALAAPPRSQKALSHALQARGFASCRVGSKGAWGYKGLKLVDGSRPDPLVAALGKYARKVRF